MTPEEAARLQLAAVDAPANLYVQACPGAGKTRTVVDRFLRVAKESAPRAVAAISFTNRAADEVARRCADIGQHQLSRYPNFVGTFDGFVATYIVRPFAQLGGPIRIVDSWSTLDVEVSARGMRGAVSLDHFEISPDGVVRFEPRPRDPDVSGAALQRLESAARYRYTELRNEGYLTCVDARSYASRLLVDHPEITQLLGERFAEILVDEAQDCSTDELEVLRHLRDAGVPLVVVCDPHQSIYEWRDADPAAFQSFVELMPRIELNGNWRSSPSICQLAASIRGGPPDQPVGPFAQDESPIIVMPYSGVPSAALGSRFAELLDTATIDLSDATVLGHRSTSAARAVGAALADPQTNVIRLATASTRLADQRLDARERLRALDVIQRLLLKSIGVDPKGQSTERSAELAGVRPDWLRRSALQLAIAVHHQDVDVSADEWIHEARAHLGAVAATEGRRCVPPGRLLRTPPDDTQSMRVLSRAEAGVPGLRHSSVHKAKGSEDRAVMVVLPPDRGRSTTTGELVDAWESGTESEAKRVFYVAVTRAQQMCALAVPERLTDRVLRVLSGRSVAFRLESA